LGKSTDRDAERRAGELEDDHRRGEQSFAERLAAHSRGVCREPDLVVPSPSEDEFSEKYFLAIQRTFPGVRFIGGRGLEKPRGVYFGQLWNVPDIKSNLQLTVDVEPTGVERLLIVDDVYSSGRTASPIVGLLTDLGLSPEAVVSLAAPLGHLHNSCGLLLKAAGLDRMAAGLTF